MLQPKAFALSLFYAACVTGSLLCGPALADNYKAEQAYKAGDFEEAVAQWQRSVTADDGAPEAYFQLGQMTAMGLGTHKSLSDAVQFYKTAALQGSAKADLRLGLLYLDGLGPDNDQAEAERYLRAAAEKAEASADDEDSIAAARVKLGDMLLTGLSGRQDPKEAAHWYRQAGIDHGVSAQARYKLAQLYELGNGVEKDGCMARQLYKMAVDGHPDATMTSTDDLKKLAQQHLDAITTSGRCASADFNTALVNLAAAIASDDEVRKDANAEALCEAAENADIPAADQPRPEQLAELKGCQSDALYYDYQGKGADYRRARLCAIGEMSDTNATPIQGHAILMMLYANGQGVDRNWPLAFRFACEAGGAGAEISGRLKHLVEMTQTPKPDPIDFCDDITSGFMMGFCSSIGTEKLTHQRQVELDTLMKAAPKAVQARYKKLYTAASAFITGQSGEEIDTTGTARSSMVQDQAAVDWTDFMEIMRAVMSKTLPQDGKVDPKAEDKALNEAYRRVMAVPDYQPDADDPDGTRSPGLVKVEGIRTVQRLWITYRDAWVEFAKAVDPELADPTLALVTAKRKDNLSVLLGEGDDTVQ